MHAIGPGLSEPGADLPIELRGWQRAALDRWNESRRGVVAVVTGGGKTWFALACMSVFLADSASATATIVVPTVALLDQWVVVLTDDLKVPMEQIAVFGGGHKRDEARRINVMVLNTARTEANAVKTEGPSLLIVDECHRAASQENRRALEAQHDATLGLSATPDRDFDDLFQEIIVPALGPIIYEYGYSEALADQVISPFRLINVRVPLSDDEQQAYNRYTRRLAPLLKAREVGGAPEADERIFGILRERARVSNGAESRVPTAVKILQSHKRQKAIVFHEQIAAADLITQTLTSTGHRAVAYHSGLGRHIRQDNLRLFRRNEADVLVTCRALDEGINVPDATLAVIVASTSSTRQRIQRLGRVLRPADGKDHAEIYTLFASKPEEQRLRDEEAGLVGVDQVSWKTIGKAG